jgi:hypothetical protein
MRTHGHCVNYTTSVEYRAYRNMLHRCYYPANTRWDRYGARGIRVCERWLGADGFTQFLTDMGFRPTSKHSLDRIDSDKNYEPANCRWADSKTQARHIGKRLATVLVTVRGEEMSLADACRKYNREFYKVRARIRKCGWSIERALEI